jgi:hypothetical protein
MRSTQPVIRFALALCVMLGLLVASQVTLAAPNQPLGGNITGFVSSPGGYPLPAGTLVKLFEPGADTVRGMAVPDLDDGQFLLPDVPNGLYVVKAVPLEASGYTQSEPASVSIINANIDIGEIALTEPQLLGAVTAPDGVTLAAADVFVYLGDGRLFQHIDAPTGNFAVGGLPVGSYALQAYPVSDDPYWRSDRLPVNITSPTFTDTVVLNLTDAQLWGTIKDDQGNPVHWATIVAAGPNGHAADFSSPTGYWALGGLADGDYYLNALPPWLNDGLLPPAPITITLSAAANPYDLQFGAPPKLVTGTVTTNTSLPVEAAQIVARRINRPGYAETLTLADGSYELNLSRGLWALTVKPITDTLPADWVYPLPPQLVYFQFNNQPESRTQNFEVIIADATVSGAVELPGGATPTFTVTVGLHSDEGVGRRVDIEADGTFNLTLPNGGYKVAVFSHDPNYLGPAVAPINVPVNGAYDLGALTLLARDAAITGAVAADGVGVEGIPVVAWRPGVPGGLNTLTGPDGLYVLAVSAGDWHVQPAPKADQPYLYTGAGEDITLAAGAVAPNVDFALIETDAVINGLLVDEDGFPVLDAGGWAKARQVGDPTLHNGAPIAAGAFSILVPAGDYHVAAILPPGSPYLSAAERQVSVASGETVTITLTVKVEDADIRGWLWDPRNEDVVEGVPGVVGAWSEGSWAAAPINAGNGAYHLEVAAGLWRLAYRIDPDAGYARLAGPRNVPVESGKTAIVRLPVAQKDGEISGVVLDPQGDPLPGAEVIAKGVAGPVFDLWLTTRSAEDGAFTLAVPYGRYRLGAAVGNPNWVNPIELEVDVPQNGASSGHTLQFRLPDATISGALTVTDTTTGGEVYLWAWSDDGGFVHERILVTLSGSQATGPYTLEVISNTTWHVGAVFETPGEYWFARLPVTLGAGNVTQDITLAGPNPKPAPVVVTFDAADPQTISLADGTSIYIPGGAMPVAGQVTLRVVPIATLPHQKHANVLRYGYAFLATDASGQPIEDHFNQDVVITFGYNEALLAPQHIYEPWLKPAYFSTTTNRWEFPESFVVDMDANTVNMSIDHFTDFALLGETGYAVYLPLTVR